MNSVRITKRSLVVGSLLLLLTAGSLSGCTSRSPEAASTPPLSPSQPAASASSAVPSEKPSVLPASSPSALSTATPSAVEPATPSTPADEIAERVSRLTTEEKIGQLVIIGMDGTSMDETTRSMIVKRHVGGIIFFKPNLHDTKQMLALSNELKAANRENPIPLWLSLDQEGGRVTRLPEEFVKFPTNLAIGKANSASFSRQIGNLIGEQLSGFGYNLDFAPVMDVNSNPDNPVIGDRSFGSSPALVSKLGTATMKGIAEKKVVPVIKHFPGHGDTSVDSHIGLPVVNYGRDRLDKVELVPFKAAIEQGADAVMVAHILLPKLDGKYPASFSKEVIGGLLRKELGFQGVVFTDDMTMGAVAENYDLSTAAVDAILAGGDIVLVCHDAAKEKLVLDALVQAVKDGRISPERLDESVERILRLKLKFGLTDDAASGPDVAALNKKARSLLNQ
ncbi:beta-N-acetylhexosaminidase [Gorillibacterium timonense]|uniref:beta-N-acetylhexosaminidase n=1 Tax=Gorillibacterium timonense TaxID=1689269 RepID=UPI00071CD492|nr:beta-N-acetylhexosaminidase [Gorillibacterium timonense]